MGICYQIILCDEFDWGYLNTSKEKHLKEFQKEYLKAGAYQCDLIAQWPHYAVFDVDKQGPFNERSKVVKEYCDSAWYNQDNSLTVLHKVE